MVRKRFRDHGEDRLRSKPLQSYSNEHGQKQARQRKDRTSCGVTAERQIRLRDRLYYGRAVCEQRLFALMMMTSRRPNWRPLKKRTASGCALAAPKTTFECHNAILARLESVSLQVPTSRKPWGRTPCFCSSGTAFKSSPTFSKSSSGRKGFSR
jgi:hypothetical protein